MRLLSPSSYKTSFMALAMSLCLSTAPVAVSHSYAQDINQQGATQLQERLQAGLDLQSDIRGLSGDQLEWNGSLMVEPSQTHYAVTFPELKIKSATNGFRTDIGLIALNARPAGTPNYWAYTMALPTPFKVFDKLGKHILDINIGNQNISGTWNDEYLMGQKVNAKLGNLSVTMQDGSRLGNIGSVEIVSNMDEDKAPHLWSGRMSAAINNTSFELSEDMLLSDSLKENLEQASEEHGIENVSLKIGSIEMDAAAKNMDIMRIRDMQDSLAALGRKIKETQNAENPEGDSEQMIALMNQLNNNLLNYITNMAESSTGSISINNFELDAPQSESDPASDVERVTFERVALGFSFSDMDKDLSGFGLNMFFDQMDLKTVELGNTEADQAFDLYQKYAPHSVGLNVRLEDMPYQTLLDMLGLKSDGDPNANLAANFAANSSNLNMEDVQQLIMQSGTRLIVEEHYLRNDMYSLDVQANMQADAAVPMIQASGTASVRFTGLEELIASIQSDMAAAPANMRMQVQQAVQGLTMMQMFGQKEIGNDGKSVYVYNFEITKNGNMTLNGADLGALMGGGIMPQ